jgi:PST family polysaccharide transporter
MPVPRRRHPDKACFAWPTPPTVADAPPPETRAGDRPQGGIGRAAAKGVMFSTLCGIAERLIGFLSLAVVVRLMTVEEAGIAMLAASTFDVILVVSTTGFGDRIIQHPTVDRVLNGTTFWLQMLVCSALAAAFFLAAPAIALLFDAPRIVPLLQVMAALIVTRAIPIVPSALLARSMHYGVLTVGTLVTSIFSAAAGIGTALAGYPIWALVAQFTASSVTYSVFAFVAARWLPPLAFSRREAWRTLTFAAPLLASGTMTALSAQASTLMIGAWLPIERVAFYRVAARLFEVLGQILIAPVQRVLLATFSALRDDRARAEEAFLSLLRVLTAVAFGAYALAGAQGVDVMRILFGPIWGESGPILGLLAIGVVGLVPRSFVNAALTAVGRTRLVLAYTAVTTVAIVATVAIASPHGVLAVAGAQSALLVATVPLSLLAFRAAFGIAPAAVLRTMPVPLLAAAVAAAASFALTAQLAHLHIFLRAPLVGLAGGAAFAAAHFGFSPRGTMRTLRAVLALRRRGQPIAPR